MPVPVQPALPPIEPTDFLLQPNAPLASRLLETLQGSVRHTGSQVYTQGFDCIGLWAQLEHCVNSVVLQDVAGWLEDRASRQSVAKTMGQDSESEADLEMQAHSEAEASSSDQDVQEEEGSEADSGEEEIVSLPHDDLEEEEPANERQTKTKQKSIVDDDFFSLAEMEKFADMAEKQDHEMMKRQLKRTEGDDDEDDESGDGDSEDDMFSIGKGTSLLSI
jgi:U3 small nucleolar RNA-associated protein MPP10